MKIVALILLLSLLITYYNIWSNRLKFPNKEGRIATLLWNTLCLAFLVAYLVGIK